MPNKDRHPDIIASHIVNFHFRFDHIELSNSSSKLPRRIAALKRCFSNKNRDSEEVEMVLFVKMTILNAV